MLSKFSSPAFVVANLLGLPAGIIAALSSSLEARTATPAPLVIPPSGQWDGNDGPWSSFPLNIGSPAQSVRVLASTSGNQPWVVLPEGCSTSDGTNCDKRGGSFKAINSYYIPSWVNQTTGVFAAGVGFTYGINANVTYGYDSIALGPAASGFPSLPDQLVGGITTKEFYMGMFGLSSLSTKFAGLANPVESYVSMLKTLNHIPSLSYGYTAGNMYRIADNKGYGSLILGGYDTSLYTPNDLTIKFNNLTDSSLMVSVAAIMINNSTGPNSNHYLSKNYFLASIDSTVSSMYLPLEVCKKFEDAFGIVWNETSQLYIVDQTLRTKLTAQNANVTFTLTNSTSETFVDIVLPYKAFDLLAQAPLVASATQYFPLKRAANAAQVTLGRVFLQEAYLIADYERSRFSIHQRDWTAGASPQPNIVSILTVANAFAGDAKKKTSVNVTAIICGAVGGTVLIAVIAGAIVMGCRRQKRIKSEIAESEASVRRFVQYHHSRQSSQLHSPCPTTLVSSTHTRSNYSKSIAPSSLWDYDRAPPPRPDSPTSFYQSEYDPVETQTISGLGAPMKYGAPSMRFSAVDWPSQYEPTIMEKPSPELSTAPFFEATAMPAPITVRKSIKLDPVCELPAREQVGKDLLNFSKKPVWI